MPEDDDNTHDPVIGWLQGGSLQPGAGGRTVRLGDHVVSPGAGAVSTSTAAVEVALAAFGIDTSDMKASMEELDEADLQAIRERTLHPADANVPKPDDFDDAKFVAIASSYAFSILDGRKQAKEEKSKGKDRRISVLTTVIIAASTLLGGGVIGTFLGQYLSDRANSAQTTEERPVE